MHPTSLLITLFLYSFLSHLSPILPLSYLSFLSPFVIHLIFLSPFIIFLSVSHYLSFFLFIITVIFLHILPLSSYSPCSSHSSFLNLHTLCIFFVHLSVFRVFLIPFFFLLRLGRLLRGSDPSLSSAVIINGRDLVRSANSFRWCDVCTKVRGNTLFC
jgi:hypothetical protein